MQKSATIVFNGREEVISLERLKPAYVETPPKQLPADVACATIDLLDTKTASSLPRRQDTPVANRSTAPCQGWHYDIANQGDSIVSRFGLVCDRQYLLNLGIGVFVIISGLVTPVLGFASDRVGRRPVTLASMIVLLAGTVGNSVAGTFAFYVSTRTVVLATANAIFILIFILLYEVTRKEWRLVFTLLVTAVGPTVVPPFVDALTILKPSWVILHGVIIVPTAILAACCYLLPESPAWLLDTWNVQRAQEGIMEAAVLNGLDTAKAAATFRAILVQLVKLDQNPHSSTEFVATDGPVQFVNRRRRAASVFLARLALNAVYYPRW
ncbi:beta-alanine transporter-like [Dermacentor silvarum]|uniref:beta-alanine transporter-like n=1 Tax=Dermacentor silvarum TaxID=543639 RepID=UPI0021008D72|nr:beta-alanine transporter-like [Dermacentor silvarum]